MIFSYNWLKDYVKKLPKPEKIAELLTLRSFEVQELKKVKSDYILDIDILPNRAGDCFSHMGIAREIAAITGLVYKDPIFAGTVKDRVPQISLDVKQSRACSRYTAKVLTGLKVSSSPRWLKERLEACGLNPINNVVDLANYVMLETGQPLHAFDFEKLERPSSGRPLQIIVRFARQGEKITTLDNQKFNLDPKILVISDAKKTLAIAGIKGGKDAEIDERTKTVVLESANFNPVIIRRASRELGLKTDASLRFEHGLDPNLTDFAVNRLAYLIQKVAGGKTSQDTLDFYTKKVYPRKIALDLNYAESLLGLKISDREIKSILGRLGFKIISLQSRARRLQVASPTFRTDISIPEDVIEEIGRVFGYDKIPAVFPAACLIPPKRNDDIFWENMAKDVLKEAGFSEVYNYSFQKEGGKIEVENPTSKEYKYLRSSLIPNLSGNIQKNIKNFNQIKIFELGKVFILKQVQSGETEKRMLTGLASEQDFYQLKGVIDTLFEKLGIVNVWYDDYQATPENSPKSIWHPKKSAEIKVGDIELGYLGELRGESKLVAFDLDFEKLKTLATEEHEYRPISRYPATIRDLAVLVPPLTRVEEVLNVIEIAGGPLVIDVDLFDIYEGEEIAEGKKNLAFRIVYQAKDRTLTSIEVYKIHQKIIKALEENPEWQARR